MMPVRREGSTGGGPGQVPYLPGRTHDATLHDQLYRYADDLQQLMERQSVLEHHNDTLRDACKRLSESRSVLDTLFLRSHDIQIVTDLEGRILRSNPAADALAPDGLLVGSELRYWLLPAYRDNYDTLIARARAGSESEEEWELQFRRDQPGAAPLIVSAQVFSVRQDDVAPRVHWVLRDITRLREILFESQITAMVFQNTAEGVMITDIEGEILAVNPGFTRITGYSREEVVGRRPNMLRSGLHPPEFYIEFWRALQETGSWSGEIYNRKKNGEVYPEWLSVNAACDAQGRILSYIAVFTDLSRLVRTERRLAYLAHHDMLTGLPNRLLFQDRLGQLLAQGKRDDSAFTLIFIDLDRFKQINDTLGHEIGDIVLKETASRLAGTVREVDTVARLGGDEFVILAPNLVDPQDIEIVCDKLIATIGAVIRVNEHDLYVGGSLGCARYPVDGLNDSSLLRYADQAMYEAKSRGGNTFILHDQHPLPQSGAPHRPDGVSSTS